MICLAKAIIARLNTISFVKGKPILNRFLDGQSLGFVIWSIQGRGRLP
jgi:hypothetical protein